MYHILKRINFVNEASIPTELFVAAYELTKDIDEKDAVFLAMSKHINCKVWSGDKVLIDGLRKKGCHEFVFTHELLDLIFSK
jgi:predicted nucleic acid-binding protein